MSVHPCDFNPDLNGAISARINDLREVHAETGLQLDDNLKTEAQKWASELARKNEWNDSPIFHDLVYRKWFYGRDVDVTPNEVYQYWESLPAMRSQLLDDRQTKIGIGCAYRYTAPKEASLFVVAFFE